MENTEEIYHFLEDFSKRKPKVIPQELNDYLSYVARTGDPVYQWSLVKSLFKEKLLNVITDFYETTPSIEIPPYPNVDPFNYDAMKNSLLERLDSFSSAPFTVQRICELLTCPRKQYNRIDKFMRAVEKNILVVSTREPGPQRHVEAENGDPIDPIVNGSDNNSEYNVDVEMEDMSWKESSEQPPSTEPQPSSSETPITVDDIEARLQAKQDNANENREKAVTQYESVTPPELNITTEEQEIKPSEPSPETPPTLVDVVPTNEKSETSTKPTTEKAEEPKTDVEMKSDGTEKNPLVIPEIKVDDVEMTEQRLAEESNSNIDVVKEPVIDKKDESEETEDKETPPPAEEKIEEPRQVITVDESSSDSNIKDEPEAKGIPEVLTSSEESSSSSDNTDGNSNSPKQESRSDSQEESNSDSNQAENSSDVETKTELPPDTAPEGDTVVVTPEIEGDKYSISDVKSQLQQPAEKEPKEDPKPKDEVTQTLSEESEKDEKQKTEVLGTNSEK